MGSVKNNAMEKDDDERANEKAMYKRIKRDMQSKGIYQEDCDCCGHPMNKDDVKKKECPYCGQATWRHRG
jgi:rRNA maturation endonuclease Nob1